MGQVYTTSNISTDGQSDKNIFGDSVFCLLTANAVWLLPVREVCCTCRVCNSCLPSKRKTEQNRNDNFCLPCNFISTAYQNFSWQTGLEYRGHFCRNRFNHFTILEKKIAYTQSKHICNSHKPTRKPKIAKELAFFNPRQKRNF